MNNEQQPVQLVQPSSDFLNRMDMANNPNLAPEKPKKISKGLIVGIIIGVIAVVGGVVAVIMMMNSGSNTQPTVTATTTEWPDEPEEEELSEEVVQRNELRANDLVPLLTALNSYQANNRGALPSDWAKVVQAVPEGLKDTATGEAYYIADLCNFSEADNCKVDIDTLTWEQDKHKIFVFLNAACKGNTKEDMIVSHTGKRKAAMFTILEGSKNFLCVNN